MNEVFIIIIFLEIGFYSLYLLHLLKKNKQLKKTIASMEEKVASYDLMMATISHEVKNPLAVILGYAQLMQKNDHRQDIIAREAAKINDLVNSLYQFTRLSQGKYVTSPALIDLKNLIENRIYGFKVVYPQRVVKLKTKLVQAPVTVDKLAVDQIITNLLTNAIRYTQSAINIKLTRSKSHFAIEIADHGMGIPEEVKLTMWQAFTKKSTQGLGLGLFITKQLVKAIHAKISFKSTKKGTSFIILLPR